MNLFSNTIIPHFKLRDAWNILWVYKKLTQKDGEEIFLGKNFTFCNAGRTALSLLVENLKLPKNKKIALPAFTCAVVALPFIKAAYEIVWIDTDENGLISLEDFKRKSKNISAVLVVHIFGQEINLKPWIKFCEKENIFCIEDCAHFLPRTKIVANARIYSFGREKILSSIIGGAIVCRDEELQKKINFSQESLPKADWFFVFKHLLQPLIFAISLPWWNFGGKIIPWILRKINFLPWAVLPLEKKGKMVFPRYKFPGKFSAILKYNWNEFKSREKKSQKITEIWQKILPKLFPKNKLIFPGNNFRVIMKAKNEQEKKEIYNFFRKENIDLREWDGKPIAPFSIDLKSFNYKKGDCLVAENFAKTYLTFPTNYRMNKNIVQKLENKKFIQKN